MSFYYFRSLSLKNYLLTVCLIAAVLFSPLKAETKSDDSILVVAAGKNISTHDFKKFLMDNLQSCGRIDTLSSIGMNTFLDSLIHLNLLVAKAEARGLDETNSFAGKMNKQRESLLISHLIEVEVLDKIITKEKLKKFYDDFGGDIRFRQIVINDDVGSASPKTFSDSVYDLIVNDKLTFQEAARKYSQDKSTGENGGEAGFRRWGQFTSSELQNAAFSLEPGEVSKPIKTYLGYHIVQVISKSKCGFEDEYRDLKYQMAAFYAERIKNARKEYLFELSKKYGVGLVDYNIKRIVERVGNPADPFGALPDSLFNVPLLFYGENKSVNLNDLIAEVGADHITDYLWHEKNFEKWLNFIASNRIALIEAEKLNLEVSEDLKNYRNQLLTSTLLENIYNKINFTPGDLKYYYKSHKNAYTLPDRIRAKQIIVDDIKTAEGMIKLAKKGNDFDKLIMQHSIDPSIGMFKGDLGYFSREQRQRFYDKCDELSVGDVTQPIMVPEGYAVLKVVDKENSRTKTYEEAANEIEKILLEKEKKVLYSKLIDKLVNKFKININHAAYKKFKESPLTFSGNKIIRYADEKNTKAGN